MTEQKKLVVYVGPYSFPYGGAAARRIYGNCISLKNAGYDVVVTTGQLSEDAPESYNGIKIVSLNERRYENLPRLIKHVLYLSAGKKTVEWLDERAVKPNAIILYSGYSPYLIKLIGWARKNKVKIIFDVVEWYDAPNFLSKLLSPYYLNIELAMRYLIKRCDALIVISDYLNNYYKDNLDSIIQVPPTVDCHHIKPRFSRSDSQVVRFVYAGIPGKKDALSIIVKAVLAVVSAGGKVELHIAGINRSELQRYLPEFNYDADILNNSLYCHGMLDHGSALDLVRNSDFSIIVRPSIRSVQAGFPTKFVESMAVGTPVIANLTSDLGKYLKDRVNGLICSDSSVESIIKVLNSCLEIKYYENMRINSRKTAELHFDAKNYSGSFKRIIG